MEQLNIRVKTISNQGYSFQWRAMRDQAVSLIDASLSPRRKKKAVHKTSGTDDKRLQNTLKRLGVNTIAGIEEVNIFMNDDVIHFTNPKGERLDNA